MLKIRKGGHKELQKYYSLLEMDFDQKELLPRVNIHKAMLNGSIEFLVIYDEESQMDIGYALTLCKSLYGYVLLKYFAVLPWFRGRGVGVDAMRLINKYYADRQGILAEITTFDDEDGEYLKKLRKFFARFGYVIVDVDYELGGTEADLMVKPIKGTASIAPVAHRIVYDFYSRVLNTGAMYKMVNIKSAN